MEEGGWMKTSNFWRVPKDQRKNMIIISVGIPKGYEDCKKYDPLKPYRFRHLSGTRFENAFREYLKSLNPRKVWNDLHTMVRGEPILVCWEPPLKPCHRRIVAEWLEEVLGVKVGELGYEEYPKFSEMVEMEERKRIQEGQLKIF